MKTLLLRIVVVAAVAFAVVRRTAVALVLGNSAYKAAGLSLANPHNDATLDLRR